MTDDELTCQDLVELVTDYFESALSDLDRARFEAHLRTCRDCSLYLEQMRRTVELTGTLSEAQIDPRARDELLRLFKDWKRARGEAG